MKRLIAAALMVSIGVACITAIVVLFKSAHAEKVILEAKKNQALHAVHNGIKVYKFQDGEVTCYTWNRSLSCVHIKQGE